MCVKPTAHSVQNDPHGVLTQRKSSFLNRVPGDGRASDVIMCWSPSMSLNSRDVDSPLLPAVNMPVLYRDSFVVVHPG